MIDVASGKRRVLLSGPEFDFSGPRVSPDGRFIACLRERHATESRPGDITLVLLDAGADAADAPQPGRDLLAGWDRWPGELAWAHDSSVLFLTADDGGRAASVRAISVQHDQGLLDGSFGGGVPFTLADDEPPVGRDQRAGEVELGPGQQHASLAAGHVDHDQFAM